MLCPRPFGSWWSKRRGRWGVTPRWSRRRCSPSSEPSSAARPAFSFGENWFASATIFLAVVARPGAGKFGTLDYAMKPVDAFEWALAGAHARETEEFLRAAG